MANNLQEALWLRVAQFIKINENKPKLFVANHFIAEGVPKTTIYRIINKIESKGELKRKTGSGRIAVN